MSQPPSASAAAAPPPDSAAILRCQLCGSSERRTKFSEPPFDILECTDCGLVYVTPRLSSEALAEVYGASYWKSDNPKNRGYSDYAKDGPLYLKTFQRRMALVNKWVHGKSRVIDIGCAAGFFIQVMAEHGHDVLGIEPSAPIAEHAKQAVGADRILIGDLDSVPKHCIAPGTFDLVTMWDVIEHIPDPQQTLHHVRQLLAPGGKLLLETQNVSSHWARMLGRRWHHYKHEEHLYHFTPQTIERLLGDCGFAVLHNSAAYAGKYVSFGFIAERAGRLGKIAGLLASPIKLMAGCNLYVNPRDEMIVVAELAQ